MDAVKIKLGAGWSEFDRENAAAGQDDRTTWNLGANVYWNNFALGASYLEDNNGVSNNGDTSTYVIGANYKMESYTFGVSYLNRQDDQGAGTHTTASDIETSRWTGGVKYKFADGMSFNSSLSYVEAESDLAGDTERSGYQVVFGTDIRF